MEENKSHSRDVIRKKILSGKNNNKVTPCGESYHNQECNKREKKEKYYHRQNIQEDNAQE